MPCPLLLLACCALASCFEHGVPRDTFPSVIPSMHNTTFHDSEYVQGSTGMNTYTLNSINQTAFSITSMNNTFAATTATIAIQPGTSFHVSAFFSSAGKVAFTALFSRV
jgi:hypothetical protein